METHRLVHINGRGYFSFKTRLTWPGSGVGSLEGTSVGTLVGLDVIIVGTIVLGLADSENVVGFRVVITANGFSVDFKEGCTDGWADGFVLGLSVGLDDGWYEGVRDGYVAGWRDGQEDG